MLSFFALLGLMVYRHSRRTVARAQAHDVEKVYVARVCGVFPAEPLALDLALAWNPRTNHVCAVPGGPRVADACPNPGPDPGACPSNYNPGSAAPAGSAAAHAGPACHPEGGSSRTAVPCNGDHEGDASRPAASVHDADAGASVPRAELDRTSGDPPAGEDRGDAHALAVARAQKRSVRAGQRVVRAAKRAAASQAAAARAEAAVATAAATRAGRFDAADAAKPALTELRRLAVAPDGRTSLVECRCGPRNCARLLVPFLRCVWNTNQYSSINADAF